MVDLILSVVFSALLFVILRMFPSMKVITFNGIVVNYFTAAIWAAAFSKGLQASLLTEGSFLPVALLTGCMFIVVFFITGLTTQRTGVAVASVASKMSMVIPVGVGLLLYNEQMGFMKAAGILLAFPAVYLVSKPSSGNELRKFRIQDLGLPVLLFIGAGVVDSMIKVVQHYFMNEQNRGQVIMMIFASAGLVGLIRVCWMAFSGNYRFITFRDCIGGVLLGSANYLSLHYLLKCLEAPGSESSQVFTLVNTGVVTLSAVIAAIDFKEELTTSRIAGVLLAVASIIVLSA